MRTARFVKNLDGFKGEARLYELTPPLQGEWDKRKKARFVVVSAINAMFSGPETFIFKADKTGEVLDWGELSGSFKGALDHEQALNNAGYKVKL